MTGPVVGVIGAGQLARMMLPAATALDVDLRILATAADDSAARAWPRIDVGAPDDAEAVLGFARDCDVITFDHELVPAPLVRDLAQEGAVHPGPDPLRFAQDKAHQRTRFAELGLPVPVFVVGDLDEAASLGAEHGWPLVVKAPRGGYDGRGVAVAAGPDDLRRAWEEVGGMLPVLVEEHVALEREVAVLLARRPTGELRAWPLVETVQRDGMLAELRVPARLDAPRTAEAHRIAAQIADVLDVVGVMAVELFVTADGLLVNEIALRPHNSGHWTIDGSRTSQFAQHLRAVLDWPLGDPMATAPAVATVNLVGPGDGADPAARVPAALGVPGAAIHLYGKQARPGRKLGHVTVCGDDADAAAAAAHRAVALLRGEPT